AALRAVLAAVADHLRQPVLRNHPGFREQAAQQRALAVVHAAADGDAQRVAIDQRLQPFGDDRGYGFGDGGHQQSTLASDRVRAGQGWPAREASRFSLAEAKPSPGMYRARRFEKLTGWKFFEFIKNILRVSSAPWNRKDRGR